MSTAAPDASQRAVAWWRERTPTARALLAFLALAVVVNAGLTVVDQLTNGTAPSGPPSSSLATAAAGYQGWADLLAAQGHPVTRLRQPLDQDLRSSRTTLVVADPASLSTAEIAAVDTFLHRGGRVVTLGVATVPLLDHVLGAAAPRWGPAPVTAATPAVAAAPETACVQQVASGGAGGSFSSAGGTTPLLGAGGGGGALLATVDDVGSGRLVMFADSSVFSNAQLALADDAQLSLDVVGPSGRPVAFDENAHGYGAGALSGLPLRWQWTLLYAVLAAGIWLWSRGRRFGPPEASARQLPPARRRYVEALATVLAGSGDPIRAVAPVRGEARRRLASRAGVAPEAGDELLARAAGDAGVPPDVTAGVLGGTGDDAGLLAAGRALAWLEEAPR